MPSYQQSALPPTQFALLHRSLLQSNELPFQTLLSDQRIAEIFAQEEISFGEDEDAVYTPAITLWGLLSQVFFKAEQRSCLAAVVRIAYESGGKAVWVSKHDLSNDFFGITRLPDGKDAQTALDEGMWKRALSILEKNLPPTHVFSAESARGLGTSRLAGDGTRPAGK